MRPFVGDTAFRLQPHRDPTVSIMLISGTKEKGPESISAFRAFYVAETGSL
jgi:hypothetical protein